MNHVTNILLEKDILLESGTNEVEVLVFRVGGYSLGINVAKVREVLPDQKITKLPESHGSMTGCFTLRDQVIPCVSLHEHLNEEPIQDGNGSTIILTEFSQYHTAFVVDAVERIHRVSWENVMAAPALISCGETPVTAVTTIDDRLILMLDFELIADQISNLSDKTEVLDNSADLPRDQLRILLADDSATVRVSITKTLHDNGFTNLLAFENGQEAWNWIQEEYQRTGDVSQVADLMLSDVEMPQMDGFRLTKNIKDHPELSKISVLLNSSILTSDNKKKGESVNADGMVTKPGLPKIVAWADELIVKLHKERGGTASSSALPAALQSNTVAETQFDPAIWAIFRNELSERVEQLSDLCHVATEQAMTDEVIFDTLRVLHSIKSAAMLTPVDEVTHLTHTIETVLANVGPGKQSWPVDVMDQYTDWLRDLANPTNSDATVAAILAKQGTGTAAAV